MRIGPLFELGVSWAEEASRARAIRAVVAAQWAVAIALFTRLTDDSFAGIAAAQTDTRKIAALPTAEQIVDGVA